MRTGWLMEVASGLASWPEGLWRASWQGAVCAALVWGLTRLWTRMPASLRAGLWWLVALKFVVSLGGPRPLALPVLPASLAFLSGQAETTVPVDSGHVAGGAVGVSLGSTERGADVAPSVGAAHALVGERDTHVGNLGTVGGEVHFAPMGQGARVSGADAPGHVSRTPGAEATGHGARPPGAESPAKGSETGYVTQVSGAGSSGQGVGDVNSSLLFGMRELAAGWRQVLVLMLLAAWVMGVAWQVRSQARSWALMRRLRRSARPLVHPELEAEVLSLSESAGLRRAPSLLVSDVVASPLATGLWSPVVVLPTKAVRRLPVEGLRMALAHEVAHLKRGDLWLGWVPALAEALLFFHPLARRAAREYALAREEACDAEALRLTGAEPADYGELLLAFGVTRPHGTAAALGASAHVHALHRRLSMLEHVDIGSSRSRRWLKVTVSALGLVALVPFQVVARQEEESKQERASSTTPVAPPSAVGPTSLDGDNSSSVPSRKGTVRTGTMDAATPATPMAAPSPRGPRPVAPMAAQPPVAPVAAAPMAVLSPAAPSPVAPMAPAAPVGERPVAPRPPLPPAGPHSVAPVAARSPAAPSPVAPMAPASPVGERPVSPKPPLPPAGAHPVSPRPMLAMAPTAPRLVVSGVLSAPPTPPTPPSPLEDDDSGYVLLSGDKATMNGSTVDLKLAKMFKDKSGGELLYVRRKGEAFIVRDAATLKAVKDALEPIRVKGEAQGAMGSRMGALGQEQGKLGLKQGKLGVQQSELALRHAELAHKRAGLHLESNRLDALPEAERERRQAELDKQEAALDKEIDALDLKQEELSKQQEELGREQEKLGQRQEEMGREMEKVHKLHESEIRDAERKVQSVIDEALRKGLGQPLPT